MTAIAVESQSDHVKKRAIVPDDPLQLGDMVLMKNQHPTKLHGHLGPYKVVGLGDLNAVTIAPLLGAASRRPSMRTSSYAWNPQTRHLRISQPCRLEIPRSSMSSPSSVSPRTTSFSSSGCLTTSSQRRAQTMSPSSTHYPCNGGCRELMRAGCGVPGTGCSLCKVGSPFFRFCGSPQMPPTGS
ncbi:hypothetical protein J8273_4477 [Carpediemonas membranifera]|uniref:Uncharacterized protein n=1 Tax=Carpediemonas membranifera TaxID=201153 RepID=A0A8J6B254_9EUKA|nr:hypothetical protein J8273_4476 [Carpediemonas membranifera]KAG9394114.1 hypothetical protein J8273_4477 [Carpediemonas membranifera]|eukprot:KAG9394113.1 hypothetical protein J8273_4476 [Carpediemonas membranifera]